MYIYCIFVININNIIVLGIQIDNTKILIYSHTNYSIFLNTNNISQSIFLGIRSYLLFESCPNKAPIII